MGIEFVLALAHNGLSTAATYLNFDATKKTSLAEKETNQAKKDQLLAKATKAKDVAKILLAADAAILAYIAETN